MADQIENNRLSNFLFFEDRALSLLARWKKFGLEQTNVTSADLIKGFMLEINDPITASLIENTGSSTPTAVNEINKCEGHDNAGE